METVLCDISAFQFHRIPPCVLPLITEPLDLSCNADRRALGHSVRFLGYVDVPLHVLVTDRSKRHSSKGTCEHLWSGDVPSGGIQEIDSYLYVTSPLLTLLTMARRLDATRLMMAMYELCGSFAVIKLLPEHRKQIQEQLQTRLHPSLGGWQPVCDANGMITDLWMRDPLVTLEELEVFAKSIEGVRGAKTFREAASLVRGICASPFEVRAISRLTLSRQRGGEGFLPVVLNHTIRFDERARSISGLEYCVADIYFPEADGGSGLVVECQGEVAHGKEALTARDADRLLGLESMGIPARLLTYSQISNQHRYHNMVRHIAEMLGKPYREKSAWLMEREQELCRTLFAPWERFWR